MHERIPLLLAAALAAAGSIAAQPQLVVPLEQPAGSRSGSGGAMVGGPALTEAQRMAREFRRPQQAGRELARAVRKVHRELAWHDDLEDAREEAVAWGRPIVWIQALGELDGFT